jgi:twitching motility protein PilT
VTVKRFRCAHGRRDGTPGLFIVAYERCWTMSRILDCFPASNQSQTRQQLSLALLAVIAQQLVPAIGHVGRYPAVEVMIATTAIRNLIRTGQDHQICSHISTGCGEGMITMDQSLAELVRTGRISRETAAGHCYHPDELRSHLNSAAQPV